MEQIKGKNGNYIEYPKTVLVGIVSFKIEVRGRGHGNVIWIKVCGQKG